MGLIRGLVCLQYILKIYISRNNFALNCLSPICAYADLGRVHGCIDCQYLGMYAPMNCVHHFAVS